MMSEVLSGEQIDALHAVDLRLTFINHGHPWPDYIDIANGPAVIGVRDKDYDLVDKALDGMASGDRVARERIFGQAFSLDTVPSDYDVVSDLDSALRQSPYVDANPFQGVPELTNHLLALSHDQQPHALPRHSELTSALKESLDIARQLQIIDLFSYADGLAAMRGLARVVADSSDERGGRGVAKTTRNPDMVAGLGDIALDITNNPRSSERKPILSFIAGRGHRGVGKLLQEFDISYTSQTTPHSLAKNLVVLRARSDPLYALKKYDANQWFRNLRAHGHEPVDTTVRRDRDH